MLNQFFKKLQKQFKRERTTFSKYGTGAIGIHRPKEKKKNSKNKK